MIITKQVCKIILYLYIMDTVKIMNNSKCLNSNTYDTFEDKVEEAFKKNGINFLSTNYNLEKQIIKDLKKSVNPSNITPENDFYSYINDRWLNSYNTNEELKYIVQIDNFRLVQDKVYRDVLNIVKEEIKHNNDKFTLNLKKYYISTDISKTKKSILTSHCDQYVSYIDSICKKENGLWKLLGYINRNEIISWGSPIMWTINPDDKHPDKYRCYLTGPQLSIIDLNIYFDDGTNIEYKQKYRQEYISYLRNIFEYIFGKNHKYNVNHVFEIEQQIVNSFVCDDNQPEEEISTYNKITKDESFKKLGINWEVFSHELGFKTTPEFFITPDINYMKCITTLLKKNWNTDEWKTYWVYIFIRQITRFILEGRDIYFNFQGKYVRGMEKSVDIEVFKIFPLCFAYNTHLSMKYIEQYKNEKVINYVKTMAEDLKTVFIRIIKRNNWLQPQTKEKAIKKLLHFKFEIGHPSNLREDPYIDYLENDLWYNMLKVAHWRTDRAIELEGGPIIDIPVIDWGQLPPKFISTQVYVVNASYTPTKNGIYIPLGYIQKPFVDLDERGIEYNLAHIGFTLGHEMSHSLDDWGSQYDEYGKLNDWWTAKDKKIFKAIQNDVIKQYEKFASYDGIVFDAAATIGEDLADISGLTICREYLRDFQLKNEDILPIQDLSFKAFFVYFAFQQRQKINKKAIEAQLKSNPHPLDKYRCNVPLSRLPMFRAIYNVKKGDKMWWHSTNRVWED